MVNKNVESGFNPEQAISEISQRVETMSRENQALFQRLMEDEKRFRRVAKAVWMVQEEERRRLAGELHDGIGQTLTALKNQLGRLETKYEGRDEAIIEGLRGSVELVSTALDDTRELSRLLRPAVLDDLGLEAALSWLARTLGQRTGLEISVECELSDERFAPDVETLVFRIVQESLTNVIKHSKASGARIAASMRGNFLAVSITDQGGGFDVTGAIGSSRDPAGSGLRGMRDRAELFGGLLKINSTPGEGTVVELTVPLGAESD